MCAICHDEFARPVRIKACKHRFCARCILTSLKTLVSCPMCRGPVRLHDLVCPETDGFAFSDVLQVSQFGVKLAS